MRVYIAARYGRRAEMLGCAQELRAEGVEVVSRWITGCHELPGIESDDLTAYPPEHVAFFAQEDLDDIDKADLLLAFSESGRGRGGRHVELGYALARGLSILMVGGREHSFAYLPTIHHVPDWPAALLWFREREARRGDQDCRHARAMLLFEGNETTRPKLWCPDCTLAWSIDRYERADP